MRFNRIIRNNKGAVLLVALFVILLLVGLAFAFSVVAISTYQSTQTQIATQQASLDARATAQVVTDQILNLDEQATGRLVNQLMTSQEGQDDSGLQGSFTGTNGEYGRFEVFFPEINDKSIIHIRVTAQKGEVASTVTTVLRGIPREVDDIYDDYNIYITSPNGEYIFDRIHAAPPVGEVPGDVMTLYISTEPGYDTFIMPYNGSTRRQFPDSASLQGNSLVTVSGDINMQGGQYNSLLTVYGTLNMQDVIVAKSTYVRDNIIMDNNSVIEEAASTYGDITINGSSNATYSVGKNIIAAGIVVINNARIGFNNNVSLESRSNIYLNNVTLDRGIRSTGRIVEVANSTVGHTITASGDVEATDSALKSLNVNGDLTLINSTADGDVKVNGDVYMINSTINGSLDVQGDVIIDGSAFQPSSVLGDVIINGSLTTQKLSNSFHQFGSDVNNVVSITKPNGEWDRGEVAVKIISCDIKGRLITPYKVVFMDNASQLASGAKSKIHTLYIKEVYRRLPGESDGYGAYIRLFGSEIENLIVAGSGSERRSVYLMDDTTGENRFVNSIYGDEVYLVGIRQESDGIIDSTRLQLYSSNNTNIAGTIYSKSHVLIEGNAHFQDTAQVHVASTLNVMADTANTRLGVFNVGGSAILNGPIGSLNIQNGASITDVNYPVNGYINSNSVAAFAINSSVAGFVSTMGNVAVSGTISESLKSEGKVTINSGAVIGSDPVQHQLYSGGGIIDNGSAIVNASLYNNSTDLLSISSEVNGGIYTLGAIELLEHSTPVGGNVIAEGTADSSSKRSINGSVQVSGFFDMSFNTNSGLSISGNVRAARAHFWGTVVNGNVHVISSGYAVWLESSHVRGTVYAEASGSNMRLGGGCSVGLNAPANSTVIYIGGQLNFSAGNIAYGNVYSNGFLSQGPLEGSSNRIDGILYSTGNVLINHTSDSVFNANPNTYTGGIYAEGTIDIHSLVDTGYIGYVRGEGSINITNYTVDGDVSGPANITLNDTIVEGSVQSRDNNNPAHWIKLQGESPIAGDIYSSGVFEQSALSPIGGGVRVINVNGGIINIKANVANNIHLTHSANVQIDDNLIIGGIVYAADNVTIGNGVTLGSHITSYEGDIYVGSNCVIGGNVTTSKNTGGDISISDNSPVTSGGVSAGGSIIIGENSAINGNVYSESGSSVNIASDVGGSVRAPAEFFLNNANISGDLLLLAYSSTVAEHNIKGSIDGNIKSNTSLSFVHDASTAAGSRHIGVLGSGNTFDINGELYISNAYIVYGNIKTAGDTYIETDVNGRIECGSETNRGTLDVFGNVGNTIRAWDRVYIEGNIAGNLYVLSVGNKDVEVHGEIGTSTTPVQVRIKGKFIQYSTVYGSLTVDGDWEPYNITEFPSVSVSGDFVLPANATKLGAIGEITHIGGNLIINTNVNVEVFGEIRCNNLIVNYQGAIGDNIDLAKIISWPGLARDVVKFYDNVHVQDSAYLLGATFASASANGPGSTLFIGRHMAARDCEFFAHGYQSNQVVALDTRYGSYSVGYNMITPNPAVITQGCIVNSRTQVKGSVYYYHTVLNGSNTDVASQKVSHYIDGNLTLQGTGIITSAYEQSYDTLTIVNGNCQLISDPNYATYIGNTNYINRGSTYFKHSFKGLYVGGSLTVGSGTSIHVDTYAHTIVNSGTIQIGARWTHPS